MLDNYQYCHKRGPKISQNVINEDRKATHHGILVTHDPLNEDQWCKSCPNIVRIEGRLVMFEYK